ncbi:maturase [Streptococcus pneumoniae]|nr:maturase [Streptococcus pneumoniae]PDQ27192.1 maturase [Streptococcus pneumoniae]PHP25183.1 maturase [Streptococcus pneumoniae]RRR16397.1 maturase [Streptococcus pneumoniae]RRR94915.1 maturase [Streptococcus pneumoniae]
MAKSWLYEQERDNKAYIADKVSGWGDHYQLVAQKSVLKRAISKPVLEKRGLVSCLDYYLERHALKVS